MREAMTRVARLSVPLAPEALPILKSSFISVTPVLARGNVNLTITATSGGISHGAPITVIVQ